MQPRATKEFDEGGETGIYVDGYTLTCDRIQLGGATYAATWPYASIHFYSIFFPGTEANGRLDWRTWAVGMRAVNAKPYLYAVLQFRWEP